MWRASAEAFFLRSCPFRLSQACLKHTINKLGDRGNAKKIPSLASTTVRPLLANWYY
jgi:hypothetical protein